MSEIKNIQGKKSTRAAGENTKLALVTGASSGIGRAFALRLGQEGYDLIVVGRNETRLNALIPLLPQVKVHPVTADLATIEGINNIVAVCANQPIALLINNAGVSHYMPFTALSADKANELLHVKVLATTLLTHAAVPHMVARGGGTVINVSGMIAYSGCATLEAVPVRRAIYAGSLAHIVTLTQTLNQELKSEGMRFQVLCPGIVATAFHERQGLDLSAIPRMSADDVVTASLRGLALGEVVCAPGVEDARLLDLAAEASLAAFAGQSPQLASRYKK